MSSISKYRLINYAFVSIWYSVYSKVERYVHLVLENILLYFMIQLYYFNSTSQFRRRSKYITSLEDTGERKDVKDTVYNDGKDFSNIVTLDKVFL